jgi:hypothetical protein
MFSVFQAHGTAPGSVHRLSTLLSRRLLRADQVTRPRLQATAADAGRSWPAPAPRKTTAGGRRHAFAEEASIRLRVLVHGLAALAVCVPDLTVLLLPGLVTGACAHRGMRPVAHAS